MVLGPPLLIETEIRHSRLDDFHACYPSAAMHNIALKGCLSLRLRPLDTSIILHTYTFNSRSDNRHRCA